MQNNFLIFKDTHYRYWNNRILSIEKNRIIELLKKYVDNRIVIFPFELEWYRQRNVDVFYTGHPILDEWQPTPKNELAEKLGINPEYPILTLYPGSREQEFKKVFLQLGNQKKIPYDILLLIYNLLRYQSQKEIDSIKTIFFKTI